MSVSNSTTHYHSITNNNQKTRMLLKRTKGLFQRLDMSIVSFQGRTSLSCLPGCGQCCLTPKVETTVLEMFPLAGHLAQTKQADFWYDRAAAVAYAGPCIFYDPHPDDPNKGRCRFYDFRPGICRLYGFSGFINKRGGISLLTCAVIKQKDTALTRSVQGRINRGLKVPLMKKFSSEIYQIDPVLGNQRWPINKAIALAIEKLGLEQMYHGLGEKNQ
jgi:Fe-S-cluster containining protein